MIKARMALTTETAKLREGCLTSFSLTGNYLLKRFVTDDNIGIVDADVGNF